MPTSSAGALAADLQVIEQPLESIEKCSPILKWAGGKGRLLGQLNPMLPPGVELRRHVEPFLGGGAMFFDRQPLRALLSDVNPALVRTYQAVKRDVEGVISHLRTLQNRHSKEEYYRVRTRYNEKAMPNGVHAATFIYLNKTCFNGLHRVNRKGEFNVPIGSYKNPKINNPAGLRAASRAFKSAEIRVAGFEALLENATPGDFVYFDPPYAPISETANFTSYTRNGFGDQEQRNLRDVFKELDRRGCKLMLSNSDVPYIRELYTDYRIDFVAAPRAISCNGKGRQKVSEVVVRNY